MFSKKEWHVYKTDEEAIDFLVTQGIAANEVKSALAAAVRVSLV